MGMTNQQFKDHLRALKRELKAVLESAEQGKQQEVIEMLTAMLDDIQATLED